MPTLRRCRIVLCIVFLIACNAGVAVAQTHGVVVDVNHVPIAGASIYGNSTSASVNIETDDEGDFVVEKVAVLRISKPGYLPRTIMTTALIANPIVVLSSGGPWAAPSCGVSMLSLRRLVRRGSQISGDHWRFVVPAGARTNRMYDADYGINSVCAPDGTCLRHGFGPLWGGPYRLGDLWTSYFVDVADMREREVFDRRIDEVLGADYRGIRNDGTHFRWVGTVGETIEYDGASQTTAALFDHVIDSMCWFDTR